MSEELDDIVKEEGLEFDTSFENITPWNGANDTGRDVRLKWMRNFEKIRQNFIAFLDYYEDVLAGLDDKFIRKDIPDSTKHLLSLLGGAVFGKYGFASGLTGFGAKIDDRGYGEMRGLTLWEWLQVPEIRFNRIDVFLGIKWRTPGGGIIETCIPDTDEEGNELSTGICTLKLEDGEYGAVSKDDIALGIYHFGNDKDATEDSDDSKGNFTFAGFATIYFRVTEVSGSNNNTFRYSLRPGFSVHPRPQMHFSCYGNFTNESRQRSVYETRDYTRMLWKQNDWAIGAQNIAMQYGDLSNLNVFGMNMEGYSIYLNCVYFTGTITQMKPDGTPIRTANDRGAWPPSDNHADYFDRFSYDGCIWLCVNESGTTKAPGKNNPDWLLQVDKGADGEDGTSVKILGSFTSTDQLPTSGNEPGDGYLIDGDLWVWDGSKFNNVGKIQGPAGESVKPQGNWYTGLHVQNLGVVRMWHSTYMCNVSDGTDNPPAWCWTDKDGNRFTFNDGGYALTGELNTAEYLTIATDGADAKSIINVDVEYAISTSNTTAPTTGWKTKAPAWENGKYIWSRTATYYSDGTMTYTGSACISGGKGIKKITEWYYRSSSATELIGGEWSTICPEWVNGTYIWTKSVIEYTDGTADEEGEVNSTGAKGESPVVADIDNEMDSVALDYNGLTTEATTITSTVSVWMGYDTIPISSISVSKPENINVTYDTNTGIITAKINKGVSLSDVSRIEISVTATYQGQTYTRNLTLSILAVKAGSPGDNATLYRLIPSASSIVKKKDGSYSISSISCTRTKTIGENTTTTTDGELKYSIDGYAEQTMSNGQLISCTNINSYITFIFYSNNSVVDKETIPLIIDGVDGEGYTNMGHWHTDMLVPKLGVVNMGGSSWTAKSATRNPPLWCWTDKDGNRFTISDGYYALTGEQNTSEYDLLAHKGEDGKDGTDGTDGKDGEKGEKGKDAVQYEYVFRRTTTYSQPSTPGTSQTDGYVPSGWSGESQGISATYPYEWRSQRTKSSEGIWSSFSTPKLWAKWGEQGLQGCIIRTSEWESGTEYRNDSALTGNTTMLRYIDVAFVRNNSTETGWEAYQCNITHVSSTSLDYTNTSYWTKVSQNVTGILASFIIAKNAKITFLQGNQLLIQEDDGTITAGASGSNSGDAIRFWAGSQNPDDAPFRVSKKGKLFASGAEIEGDVTANRIYTPFKEVSLPYTWYGSSSPSNMSVRGRSEKTNVISLDQPSKYNGVTIQIYCVLESRSDAPAYVASMTPFFKFGMTEYLYYKLPTDKITRITSVLHPGGTYRWVIQDPETDNFMLSI